MEYVRWLSLALPVATLATFFIAWRIASRRIENREALARERLAYLCPHGKSRSGACRPCAEEFAREREEKRPAETKMPWGWQTLTASDVLVHIDYTYPRGMLRRCCVPGCGWTQSADKEWLHTHDSDGDILNFFSNYPKDKRCKSTHCEFRGFVHPPVTKLHLPRRFPSAGEGYRAER